MSRVTTAATALVLMALAIGSSLAGTAHAAPTRTVQLTGNQLASALLPQSAFPHGYKPEKGATFSSGGSLESSKAKYNIAAMSCSAFYNGPSLGYGETAAAGNGFGITGRVNHGDVQNIYQFASSGAATTYYRDSYAAYNRCRSVSFPGVTLKVASLTSARVDGLPAFQADMKNTFSGTGPEDQDYVFVVSGADVLIISPFGWPSVGTRPAVSSVASGILARLRAMGG